MKPQDDKHVFGSKFQDFGAVPSDAVWKGIEATLPEKRKKPLLLWWWTSGIAASLIIGVTLFTTDNQSTSGKMVHTVSNQGQRSSDRALFSGQKSTSVLPEDDVMPTVNPERQKAKSILHPEASTEQNQTPFIERNPTETNQANEHGAANEIPEENWANLVWKRFGFVPTELSIGKRDFSDNQNKKRWWMGVTVEQSNRIAMNSETSEPPPTVINSSADNSVSTSAYHWNRTQTIQLMGGFDWRQKWSFGTGLEYSSWNKPEGSETIVLTDGYSVGIPVFATFHFYSTKYFRLGAQLDIRQRYISCRTELSPDSGLTYNPGEGLSSEQSDNQLRGFQTQVGFGLNAEVPFYKRFTWNTTVEYQHSGYRSNELQPAVNGSWLGLKTGVLIAF